MKIIQEALNILKELGLPKKQQNDRSARTLIALLDLQEGNNWNECKQSLKGIHDIINYIKDYLNFEYAENSRESIRRQTIHQFIQANILIKNPDNPERPVNSGKTVYSVTDEFFNLIKTYNSEDWEKEVNKFKKNFSELNIKYKKEREVNKIPIKIKNKSFNLSPGKHNILQKKIIEEFASIFAKGSELLYLGDTADKELYVESDILEMLNIPYNSHKKLPDILLYDKTKNWLFLIEAVTSHGPFSPKRIEEIELFLKNSSVEKVYVSAFLDSKTFKKYSCDIAWETEVWIAERPTHMIHFNGDKFLGPYK